MRKPLMAAMLAAGSLTWLASCSENSALTYLENAEVQYSEESEKQNIVNALDDVLTLSPQQLAAKRYPDYSGNEQQWDLRTLFERYFVPEEQGRTLGDDFYEELKAP